MAKKKSSQITFKGITHNGLSKADFALMLYHERTPSELLMSKRLTELEIVFDEQVVIGAYVVDFLLTEHGAVLEVDGAYHKTPEQQNKDRVRTKFLNSKGYRVVRVWNGQVKKCDVLALLSGTPPKPKIKTFTPARKKKKKPISKAKMWLKNNRQKQRQIERGLRFVR
jgi:very-short-patch-repair endonuclease